MASTTEHGGGDVTSDDRSGADDIGAPGDAATPAAATPVNMTTWGRRAARLYLLVAGLALVAMLVETLLGHPGTGTMFAAILAAPWSMLAASLLPPLPRDWPMAAGLAIRMAPLALFMLLNAAIIAGIAARSERDVRGVASRASLLLVLLAPLLLSGCILTSRQVVLVAAPTETTYFFNTGVRTILYTFDLYSSPAWREHRLRLSDVTDLTFMGTFTSPLSGQGVGPTMYVTVQETPDAPPSPVRERPFGGRSRSSIPRLSVWIGLAAPSSWVPKKDCSAPRSWATDDSA